LERGHVDSHTVATLERICVELDIRLDIVARWRGGDLDRLLGAGHSALHEAVARYFLSLAGWILVPEVSFAIYGERGVIDILAWHPQTRTLLVIELKTEITDVQEMLGTFDRKLRLATQVARDRGWHPSSVSGWVIVAEGSTNRRRVRTHAAVLGNALPDDGAAVRRWLRRPAGRVLALSLWSYAHTGNVRRPIATPKRVRHGPAGGAERGRAASKAQGESLRGSRPT
jgi:hypothetical protein